ncbi:MAG: glycerol-3-phosphate 1-O-acyltransferase PlsY [Coprococcus sp.]|nr:glycerol-3-phosphate 1-O-acyltransferase PlsY [Coprococcus sp.]
MDILIRAICLVGGYGAGLIQTAYIYGKLKGVDIREHGSGNSGTTNALRVLGKKAGLIVFLGDFLKGIIACSLTHIILGQMGIGNIYTFVLYTGLGVVLGHNFPFYMQFKGGKGIAAGSGMIIGLWDWRLVVILLVAFIVSVAVTKYVSVGSITIMIGFFVLYTVFAIRGDYDFTSKAMMIEGIIMSGIIAAMAVFRHRQNISRLIAGTENKLSFGSKK